MKSKDKKVSSKTNGLLSDTIKQDTKHALQWLKELAEEVKRQKAVDLEKAS